MTSRPFARWIWFSALAVPATALSLKLYLVNHPLSATKTRTIRTTDSIPPSCASSRSVCTVVNPNSHPARTDSRSITLSKSEVGNAGDEEILARLVKGFFGGWIFTPEKELFDLLHALHVRFLAVGFSKIQHLGPEILFPSELSRETLPRLYSPLFRGHFLVLDVSLSSSGKEEVGARSSSDAGESYIDIGFGDDRTEFAGVHRFEVIRDTDANGGGQGNVTLRLSSLVCNPTTDRLRVSNLGFSLHKFYSMCLFRDGVAEVLKL